MNDIQIDRTIRIDATGLNLTEAEKRNLGDLGCPIYEWKIYENGTLIRHCTQFFKNKKTGEIYAYDKVTETYIQVEL